MAGPMIDFKTPRRPKRKQQKLFFILFLLVVIIFGYYIFTVNSANSANPEIKNFTIPAGWGVSKIADALKQEGLIKNSLVFKLYVWQRGIKNQLQGGEYFLAQNLSLKELAEIISHGASATQEKTLTFIEGWNNQQIAQYLLQQGLISRAEEFFAVVQKKAAWWDNYAVLADKPANLDLEGYLFPDTYRVFSGASVTDIVKKMLANLEIKLTPEMRQAIADQNRSIHEILTLASILEKEVNSDQDRKKVADIFYKRLKAGMPLQADSTVNYATGKSVSRASAKDLEIDSPYNTYKYPGLPPGPISAPSLSAIEAAVYPASNPYWYFLTTPDGQVIYSVTHEEHVAAKAEYYR